MVMETSVMETSTDVVEMTGEEALEVKLTPPMETCPGKEALAACHTNEPELSRTTEVAAEDTPERFREMPKGAVS